MYPLVGSQHSSGFDREEIIMVMHSRRQFISSAGLAALGLALNSLAPRRAAAQAALAKSKLEFGSTNEVPPPEAGINPEKLKALGDLFEKQIRDGIHPGAQLTVMKGDKIVFDRWGGIAIKPTTPMTHETKQLLFSSTKPLGAACIMMLVEEGYLGLNDPVVKYWPAFSKGDAGKSAITIKHVLGHQGGFPKGPDDFTYENFNDPAAAMHAMERVKLQWEPGSKFEYHPLNYGWVLGELIRRVSGMPVEKFMRERLFLPIGAYSATLGVPPADLDKISFMYRVNDREHPIEIWNSPGVRMATCCASNGHMPASDLVKFYRMMGNGGAVRGQSKNLLKEETVKLMTQPGVIEKTGEKSPYGLGFFVGRGSSPGAEGRGDELSFEHGGSSSSFGRYEPKLGLSIAFITNGHQDDDKHKKRMEEISVAIRALVA